MARCDAAIVLQSPACEFMLHIPAVSANPCSCPTSAEIEAPRGVNQYPQRVVLPHGTKQPGVVRHFLFNNGGLYLAKCLHHFLFRTWSPEACMAKSPRWGSRRKGERHGRNMKEGLQLMSIFGFSVSIIMSRCFCLTFV
ncbi:uncharacterized protein BJX67DRAFT_361391 [Aspergillus lucknowensis]|uniref:Uncharacterized protein n=1 Tax=Aspergillus lucknowensis TaxID=176173 RepID=A0ABR4LIH8_9EURO